MSTRTCTTHHYACSCREAAFAAMASEIKQLHREREQLLDILSDVEVVIKTYRNAVRQSQLVERIESALDNQSDDSCRN